jgi:hypothetical protein
MSEPQHTIDVTVSNGKYRVILPAEGGLHALRHGEPWRDLAGDKLVLALASELDDARQAKAATCSKHSKTYSTARAAHWSAAACC